MNKKTMGGTATQDRTQRRTTRRVLVLAVGLLAVLLGTSLAQAAAADWTTTGTAHTRSITNDNTDILLNYNNDGHGRFSMTANYSTVATTTGADAVDYSWNGCHSWYQARGALQFFADGPSGRSTQTVHSGSFWCGQTVAGQVTLNVTEGYTWGVTVSGSHFDSSYLLRGSVRLVGENDVDGDGVPDDQDPDVVAEVVAALPVASFNSGGQQKATLSRLDEAESLISAGDIDAAIDDLEAFWKRIDGCDSETASPDKNDWIVDCADQIAVRQLIDDLILALETA